MGYRLVHEAYEALASSNKLAVIGPDGQTLTFKDLFDRAVALSEHLPLGTVCSVIPRSVDLVVLYLACSIRGSALLPMPLWEEAKKSGQKREVYENSLKYALQAGEVDLVISADLELDFEGIIAVKFEDIGSKLLTGPEGKSRSKTLLKLLSGGSTGNPKLYNISHEMVISELVNYPFIAKDLAIAVKGDVRVLQQSPAVWPASLFGQVNIALAFKGTLVIANAKDSKELAGMIEKEKVTIVGGAPPQLLAVADHLSPTHSVSLLFIWGEALKSQTAQKLKSISPLIELLIATEYWLCMYGVGDGKFSVVPDCQLRVVDPDAQGIGQLGLAGPMVCQDELVTQDLIHKDAGTQKIQFVGRKDFMTKVGANWFNVSEIETKVQEVGAEMIPRITNAVVSGDKLVVSVESDCLPCDVQSWLAGIRAVVKEKSPVELGLRILAGVLPRTAVGKIDRRAIVSLLAEGKRTTHCAQENAVKRMSTEIKEQLVFAVGFGLACGKYAPLAPFMYLASLYVPRMEYLPHRWVYSAFSAGSYAMIDFIRRQFPFGVAGLIVLAIRLRMKKVITVWSLLGVLAAIKGGRLASWSVAFWAGAGQAVRDDSSGWTSRRNWKRLFGGILFFMKSIPDVVVGTDLCSVAKAVVAEEPVTPEPEEQPEGVREKPDEEVSEDLDTRNISTTAQDEEKEWWEKKPVDYISFGKGGGKSRRSSQEGDSSGGPNISCSTEEFIDYTLRLHVGSEESLRGLSSLKITELVQALRVRVPAVSASLIMSCSDLDELRNKLVALTSIFETAVGEDKTRDVRIQFSPGQVNRPCRWMLKSKQPIDRLKLREALIKMEAKHPLLRSQMMDPKPFHSFLYDAGVMVCNVKRWMDLTEVKSSVLRALVKVVGLAVHNSWVKLRVYKAGQTPAFWVDVLTESEVLDFEQLRRSIVNMKRQVEDVWYTLQRPLQAHIFRLPEGTEFLLISVKHSVSDGNSAFPLLDDLAEFYQDEAKQVEVADPIPALEERFKDGLLLNTGNPNRTSLRTQIFYSRSAEALGGGYYRHYICFESAAIRELRTVASNAIETGFDSVLLSIIMMALMRTDKNGKETMTLYCPLRDGVNESSYIGLLADWRDITVQAAYNATVLDVVFEISEKIRKRDWEPTLSPGGPESVLLNWLPFDGKRRLADKSWEPYNLDKVTQRWNKMTNRDFDPYETPSGRFRSMSLEQYDADGDWWLRFDVATRMYPPEWMMCFGENVNRTFTDILNNPVVPLLG